MKKITVSLLASSIMLSSCATVFTGTKDKLSFTSEPAGAHVFYKDLEKCVTPCETEIQRLMSKQVVVMKKEGFKDQEVLLKSKFNPITLINIAVGGIIGMGIDMATGSFMKKDQKEYNAVLEQVPN